MKQLSVKTKEISIGRGQKENLCDTFVYEPSNVEEERLGKLYITGQVNLEEDLKDDGLFYLMNLLASVIKREYYSNSKRPPLTSLEHALKKANATLNSLAEKGNTGWVGNLHFISGCLAGGTLHLACSGNAKSILFREGALTDIGEIIPNLGSGGLPFKAFSSIASGKLEEGDLIIFSTPVLWETINIDELKPLIKPGDSIEEIHQKIQEALSQSSSQKDINLGAIILKVGSPKEIPSPLAKGQRDFYQSEVKPQETPEKKKEVRPEVSDEGKNIFPRQELVKIFSQTLFILQKLLLLIAKRFLEAIKVLTSLSLLGLKKLIFLLAVSGLRAARIFASSAKSSLINLYHLFRKKFNKTKKFHPVPAFEGRATPRTKLKSNKILSGGLTLKNLGFIFRSLSQFNRLPSSSRALLAISLILAILLSVSLGVIYKKRVFEVNLKQYGGLLEKAHQKEDRAEAALIYQDEEKARFLLIEARDLVATVVNGTDYFEEECSGLLSRLKTQEDKVDKITRIDQPKLIFDFSEAPGFRPQDIFGLGNSLYVVGGQNSFYRLGLKNLKGDKLGVGSAGVGRLKNGVAIGDSIVFYTDTPGIAVFEREKNRLTPVDTSIWQPPLSRDIKGMAAYHNNIYLLDLEQNQILKSYKTLVGCSKPRPWLKEEVNLEKASSLAIDGAIYVLKENGEILKYLRGKPAEFKNPKLFNPLKKTTKIFTTPSFKNIYIIDQAAKKVVVIDKNGGLVGQYFSEKFDDLKNMFIAGDETTIYLLNDNKIYQITLN